MNVRNARARSAMQELLALANLEQMPNQDAAFTGSDPVFPTPYLVGTAGAAVLGAVGLAVSQLWFLRTKRIQEKKCVSGYLTAYGSLIALARRVREGGSWLVRVSLARTGKWIVERGFFDDFASVPKELEAEELKKLLVATQASQGLIQHLKPVLGLSETPPYWERPPVPLGTHPAQWPKRL